MSLSGHEIRKTFLDYFASKGHARVASSPLVPQGDATLMFANAGMVQFKNVFTGDEARPYSRATTSQKCLRVSGKHNDFENVGRTARHHTFFEMLGNFSFGDYFKREAIAFAWELLTVRFGLPEDRLYATVFTQDDEAHDIWTKEIGLPEGRVVRKGEKDNYWAMGDTGPNGPCSEIILDQGPDGAPDWKTATIHDDADRFLELWNLVFMQFNTDAGGVKTRLPKPSIDTGAGLERVAAVLQGKFNNYDSDLFTGVLRAASEIAGKAYGAGPESDVSLRVVADHIRAMTFLIGDGVLPSNEGRGYVLRRIMRRAARHGVLLGLAEPFLFRVSGAVVEGMNAAYPELTERRGYIEKIIRSEEERFHRAVAAGLRILGDAIGETKAKGGGVLPGDLAFKLYDTFGFPLDLTQDVARDAGMTVDEPGFAAAMEGQRARSSAAWKGTGAAALTPAYRELGARGTSVEFNGYETLTAASGVVALIRDGEIAAGAAAGDAVEVVAANTPFYAEKGGQVGDRGRITGDGVEIEVTDTQEPVPGLIVHKGRVLRGRIEGAAAVTLEVDAESRKATQRNHTATHLLHHALRAVLGDDARQAGSLVTPDRLRFDFTYFQKVSEGDLARIEGMVNGYVRANRPVAFAYKAQADAVAEGAMALFGEKYGDTVRVVAVEDVSKELCGGTHCAATGEIGLIRIVGESAIAAGVRRIEALTGEGAYAHDRAVEAALRRTAELLKATPLEVPEKVEKLVADLKRHEKELQKAGDRAAADRAGSLLDQVREIGGVKFLAARVDVASPKDLRPFAVQVRDKLGSGVLLLAAAIEGRVSLVCMVTADLTERFPAGKIIREVAPLVGGGGGGKADLAEAGGKNPDGIPAALAKFYEIAGQG